jgi:hypothetical protein
MSLDTPRFYIPDNIFAVASHELPLLSKITPKDIMQIDEVTVQGRSTLTDIRHEFPSLCSTSLSTSTVRHLLAFNDYYDAQRTGNPRNLVLFLPLPPA